MTATCAHCGLPCGDFAGGHAGVTDAAGELVPVCHPNDPQRPDCYVRATVWNEPLGALRDRDPKPAGLRGISEVDDAFLDMVALSEELGLYDDE